MVTIIIVGGVAAVAAVAAGIYISARAVVEIQPYQLELEERNVIMAEMELGDIVAAIEAAEEQGFVPAVLLQQRDEKVREVEAARAALAAADIPERTASQPVPATQPVEAEAPLPTPALGVALISRRGDR